MSALRTARLVCAPIAVAVLAVAPTACGEDSTPAAATEGSTPTRVAGTTATATGKASKKRGTTIKLGPSQFGKMLFDGRNQAIYLFAKEKTAKPACYGACAKAWPPVLTKAKPVARGGARSSLLATTKRRGGTRQVTYKGHPLYFYAHEKPRQVLCHDVEEYGGLWLVVKGNGDPVPSSR